MSDKKLSIYVYHFHFSIAHISIDFFDNLLKNWLQKY